MSASDSRISPITACCLALLLIAVGSGGCRVSASLEPPTNTAPKSSAADAWTRTDLYFGLSKRGGASVSEEDWNRFVDDQITPRFPDGFTVTPAQGHYLQDGQVIVEPSKVVTILHQRAQDVDDRINALVKEYVQRFNQDSVLRCDEQSSVRFIAR